MRKPTRTRPSESERIHTAVEGITIKDSGKRQTFETGANRDIQEGKGRFDLLPPWAIEQVAKLYEAGCQKYGDRNWEKGMPVSRYLNSALRHLFKTLRSETDENHLLAACWNLLCALDTIKRIELGLLPKTLDDLPKYNWFPKNMGETVRGPRIQALRYRMGPKPFREMLTKMTLHKFNKEDEEP